MDYRKEFAIRLKKIRKELDHTPQEFASILNVKFPCYYSYESGRTMPPINMLINIAQHSNVSLDWLCGMAPIYAKTSENKEVSALLTELLQQSEAGKTIEVNIVCRGEERREPYGEHQGTKKDLL